MNGPLGYWVRGQMDTRGRFVQPGQQRRSSRGPSGGVNLTSSVGAGMFAPRPWQRPDPNPMPRLRLPLAPRWRPHVWFCIGWVCSCVATTTLVAVAT